MSSIDEILAQVARELEGPIRQPRFRSTRDEKKGPDAELKVVEDLAPQFTGQTFADKELIEAENDRTNTKTGTAGPPFRESTYKITQLQRNRYNQIITEKEDRERRERIQAFKQSPEGIEESRRLAEQRELEEAFFQDELQSMIDAEIRRMAEREIDIETRARAQVPPPVPDLGDGGGGKGEEFDDPVMRSDLDALIFDPVKNEFRSGAGNILNPGIVEKAFASDYGLSGIRDIMNLEQREKGKPYAIPDEEGRKVSSTMLQELLKLEGANVVGNISRQKVNERAQKIFGTQLPEDVGKSTRTGMETILFGRPVGFTEEFRAGREAKGVTRIVFNKKFYKDFYKKLNDYHQSNKK